MMVRKGTCMSHIGGHDNGHEGNVCVTHWAEPLQVGWQQLQVGWQLLQVGLQQLQIRCQPLQIGCQPLQIAAVKGKRGGEAQR